MNKQALELYLYMGSTEPVITWLKSEGVKTRAEAAEKLSPLVKNIMVDMARIGGGTLAGTSNGSTKILAAFPETV